MPYVHCERRLAGAGALNDFDDELQILHSAGVRAVVSLLNIPTDLSVYNSAGFAFLCLPVPDGGAPTMAQADEFVRFVSEHRTANRPVAVHCEGGIGRTGTLLAVYLISQGDVCLEAIRHVRAVENVAIETTRQIQFLEDYATRLRSKATQQTPS